MENRKRRHSIPALAGRPICSDDRRQDGAAAGGRKKGEAMPRPCEPETLFLLLLTLGFRSTKEWIWGQNEANKFMNSSTSVCIHNSE
jgi:hypothetical protein